MMRTIETTGIVTAEHTIMLTLPDDVPAGTLKLIVVLPSEQPDVKPPFAWNQLPTYDLEFADNIGTFRREEMYGDDGR